MFQTKSIAFFALPFASILLLELEKYFKGVSSLSPHQALVGSGREVQDWVQMVCVCLCVCVCSNPSPNSSCHTLKPCAGFFCYKLSPLHK